MMVVCMITPSQERHSEEPCKGGHVCVCVGGNNLAVTGRKRTLVIDI